MWSRTLRTEKADLRGRTQASKTSINTLAAKTLSWPKGPGFFKRTQMSVKKRDVMGPNQPSSGTVSAESESLLEFSC